MHTCIVHRDSSSPWAQLFLTDEAPKCHQLHSSTTWHSPVVSCKQKQLAHKKRCVIHLQETEISLLQVPLHHLVPICWSREMPLGMLGVCVCEAIISLRDSMPLVTTRHCEVCGSHWFCIDSPPPANCWFSYSTRVLAKQCNCVILYLRNQPTHLVKWPPSWTVAFFHGPVASATKKQLFHEISHRPH